MWYTGCMKNPKNTILSFTVLYKKDPEGGYVAFVPSLPGCHSQGDTIEETEHNIQEAIELYLESLESHGEKIPQEGPILSGTIQVPYPSVSV